MALTSLGPNIHITPRPGHPGLTHPEGPGAVLAVRCPMCGVTEIVWNELAVPPAHGDFWLMTIPCITHCFLSLGVYGQIYVGVEAMFPCFGV
jgi:hypothetical protein